MSAPEMDDAIRNLIRDVAIATVEACADRLREPPFFGQGSSWLLEDRRQIVTMETADETEKHPVHDLRALGGVR